MGNHMMDQFPLLMPHRKLLTWAIRRPGHLRWWETSSITTSVASDRLNLWEIGDVDETPLVQSQLRDVWDVVVYTQPVLLWAGWSKHNEHRSDDDRILWPCHMTTVNIFFLEGQAINVKSLLTLRGCIDRSWLLFTVQSKLLSDSWFQICIGLGKKCSVIVCLSIVTDFGASYYFRQVVVVGLVKTPCSAQGNCAPLSKIERRSRTWNIFIHIQPFLFAKTKSTIFGEKTLLSTFRSVAFPAVHCTTLRRASLSHSSSARTTCERMAPGPVCRSGVLQQAGTSEIPRQNWCEKLWFKNHKDGQRMIKMVKNRIMKGDKKFQRVARKSNTLPGIPTRKGRPSRSFFGKTHEGLAVSAAWFKSFAAEQRPAKPCRCAKRSRNGFTDVHMWAIWLIPFPDISFQALSLHTTYIYAYTILCNV